MSNKLIEGCNQLGISLTEGQMQQFEKYYELLIEKNKVMNLTAITEYDEVIVKHFLDSLTLVKGIAIKKGESLIDVGTGAGFPGIPLKIAFPELQVVLLDSLNKRVKFLNEVINDLNLKGIEAIHGRAEDAARNVKYRETFDYSVSRAVANLSSLSEYCVPFVKKGGCFISYKGGNVEEELAKARKAILLLGGSVKDTVRFTLAEGLTEKEKIDRTLIIIEKKASTSKKYPRKSGLPTKEPLE